MDSITLVVMWVLAVSLVLYMAFGVVTGWQRSKDHYDELGRPKYLDWKPVTYSDDGSIASVGGQSVGQPSMAWVEGYVARYNRKFLKPGQIPLRLQSHAEDSEVTVSRAEEPVKLSENGSDAASSPQPDGQPTVAALLEKPLRRAHNTFEDDESDGFETLPFTETWRAGLLSKVEMTESILVIEADDGRTFTADDAALPDYVHELKRAGYSVELNRIPDSDPPQYVLRLRRS